MCLSHGEPTGPVAMIAIRRASVYRGRGRSTMLAWNLDIHSADHLRFDVIRCPSLGDAFPHWSASRPE
jgi:hypothetical protein